MSTKLETLPGSRMMMLQYTSPYESTCFFLLSFAKSHTVHFFHMCGWQIGGPKYRNKTNRPLSHTARPKIFGDFGNDCGYYEP